MSVTIASLIPLAPVARQPLLDAGHDLLLVQDAGSRQALIARSGTARIAITNGEGGLSAAEIGQLPALEHICAIGVGFENIDLDTAAARGISVTNGRGTNDSAVADHTFALMLGLSLAVPQGDAMVRAGRWADFATGAGAYPFLDRRRGIFGKRLGILGLGRIGTAIAERGAGGFAMPVAYHSRRAVQESPFQHMSSAVALAEWADVLVVATPGGAGTRHLVDAKVLTALGSEGILINIGRGSVVETDALVAALRGGTIRGAALDVVEGEPNIPDALLGLDNLILTPHMAGRGPEPLVIMAALLARNVAAFLADEPFITPVLERDGTRAIPT